MELQIGDRLTDETGEWEIASRPYTSKAEKDAHVRVKKIGEPEVTQDASGTLSPSTGTSRLGTSRLRMQRLSLETARARA